MSQLTAFVARSFLPEDERRLEPVLRFLGTFEKMGFICRHAEAAEVQSVSTKVRTLIDESDVFIGIFTRRHPIYVPPTGFSAAWDVFLGRPPAAKLWSAPPWVLQESGYALQRLGPGKLILLRETDVEIPGLQGDLEYVPFVAERPADVFSKLSEMVHGLLADVSGIEVRTIVSERTVGSEAASEPVAPSSSEPPTTDHDIIDSFMRMTDAAQEHSYEGISQAWEEGIRLIEQGRSDLDRVTWDSFYFEARFRAGAPDGLDALKRLHAQELARPEPIVAIARCLLASEESEDAGRLYLKAAQLSDGQAKSVHLLEAAAAFRTAKKYGQGKDAAREAFMIAQGQQRVEALVELYHLYKAGDESYLAYATAEAALQENPRLGIRFGLGLDYHRRDLTELALLHFKFLYDRDGSDGAALHNLALMYADCKLPISAVSKYRTAIGLGEALSAANLGFIYLEAGIADDARVMVQKAMLVEAHPPRLEKCLAAIVGATEDEESKEKELLRAAREKRDFLARMGKASYAERPAIQGNWRFPFGEMALTLSGSELAGEAEVRTERGLYGGFSAILSGSVAPEEPPKIETYSFRGTLIGAVCQFTLAVTDKAQRALPAVNALSALLGAVPTVKSGFLVFESDGRGAIYAELVERKVGELQQITRIG